MDFNPRVYGFVEDMDIYDEIDATWAMARAIFDDPIDPVDDWLDQLETAAEYTPLVATSLTLEQLLEDLGDDLVAPLIYPQLSFLQSSPMHCQAQFDNQPTVTHTKHLEVRLRPIGVFDGKVIYGAPGDRVPPPVNICSPQKRNRVIEEHDDRQYVKRPSKNFRLYSKEQRPNDLAELRNSDCAVVNTIIGQMFDNQPTVTHTKHLEVRLRPIGVFDGKGIYGAPGDRVPPPVNVCSPQKRNRVIEEHDDRQYVKRPSKNFRLYSKEQRPNDLAELRNSDCAVVNTIIGQMFDNQPTVTHTKHLEVRLRPIGVFDGKGIYGAPGDRVPPPVNVCSPQKRKRVIEEHDDRQYVKRPSKNFRLYSKEQRPNDLAELRNSDCAVVNTIIGQMPTVTHTKHLEVRLRPIGVLKRNRVIEEHDDRQYVKRPSKNFRLYSKEQRPNDLAELRNSDCAVVNTIIGQMFDNQPTVTHTKHLEVRLRPIGVFDGKGIYGAPGDRVPPPVNVCSPQKRNRVIEEHDDRQYVKRPSKNFRLYSKEQRPNDLAELRNSDCAVVNTIIGQMPTVTHTKHLEVRLRPIEVLKRKRVIEEHDDRQYVKKPPNAFMLYRKEQRPKVLAELRNSDSAAVNTIIGQMWKALSKKQQEKYYEEYERLRQIHNQLYPDWSARDNYGKKRKRSQRKASAKTDNRVSPGSGRPSCFAPSWRES